jgi:hypothetical protein
VKNVPHSGRKGKEKPGALQNEFLQRALKYFRQKCRKYF